MFHQWETSQFTDTVTSNYCACVSFVGLFSVSFFFSSSLYHLSLYYWLLKEYISVYPRWDLCVGSDYRWTMRQWIDQQKIYQLFWSFINHLCHFANKNGKYLLVSGQMNWHMNCKLNIFGLGMLVGWKTSNLKPSPWKKAQPFSEKKFNNQNNLSPRP